MFGWILPFLPAICAAYGIGLITAFVLNRRLVFRESTRPLYTQAMWFFLVNLFALAQTVIVSLFVLHYVLPELGVRNYTETIAHAVGIATPIFTSYVAHKHLSFR